MTRLDLGCEVRLASGGEPLDVVVMDGSLVWCGDVAPLAYPRRDDCALRFVSREVAAELVVTPDTMSCVPVAERAPCATMACETGACGEAG